jgi:small subunit ribosomal protein S9
MSELNSSAETIDTITEVTAALHEPVIDKLGRAYGTGKRKTSIARVWIKKGSGKFVVNNLNLPEYFSRDTYVSDALKPLVVSSMLSLFDVFCTVKGGGSTGQAGAIRHGLSKALNNFHPSTRKVLKQNGLLTRDSRVVERKKYGKHKARKSTQFSKR